MAPRGTARPFALLMCMLAGIAAGQAKIRPAPALDANYVAALAAADRFLQAWQAGDLENGMVLLSSHLKTTATSDTVEKFFSNSGPSAYEIERGKLLARGRYEFPVVLVVGVGAKKIHRKFSSIVMVDTGRNDWAVDKLP